MSDKDKMTTDVYDNNAKVVGQVDLPDRLFNRSWNPDLVHQALRIQEMNRRTPGAHVKDRSEVSGGGKKPWRQKGTGRARHGSIRSPIWKGGGVTHGPSKDVNFKKKITTTAARKALAIVLSARVTEGRLLIVNALNLTSGKTKDAIKAIAAVTKGFKSYKSGNRILLAITGNKDDAMLRRSVGNLQYVDAYRAADLNALIALSYPYVIATKDAIAAIEKSFSMTK